MSVGHDTSAIPDNPEYWDALTKRIATRAAGRRSMLEWLGRRPAPWIATAAVLAAAAALIMLTSARAAPASVLEGWTVAMGPRDAVGRVVNAAAAPPALAELLLGAREGRAVGEGVP